MTPLSSSPVDETLLARPSELRELVRQERSLVCGLEALGWTLAAAEVDMTRMAARVQLRRADPADITTAIVVTLDARNGRCSTTRERIRVETVTIGRRGDRCPVSRLATEFVGREHHEGLRSGLRWLCSYVAENTGRRQVEAREVRALFAPLMGGRAGRSS